MILDSISCYVKESFFIFRTKFIYLAIILSTIYIQSDAKKQAGVLTYKFARLKHFYFTIKNNLLS